MHTHTRRHNHHPHHPQSLHQPPAHALAAPCCALSSRALLVCAPRAVPPAAPARWHRPHYALQAAADAALLALAVPARAPLHLAACALGTAAATCLAFTSSSSSSSSSSAAWQTTAAAAADALALCLALVTGPVDAAASTGAGRSAARAAADAAVYGALAALLRANALVHAHCAAGDARWRRLQHAAQSTACTRAVTPSTRASTPAPGTAPRRLLAARAGAALVLGAACAGAVCWGAVPQLRARAHAAPAVCDVLDAAARRWPCVTRAGAGRVHAVRAALRTPPQTRAVLAYCLAPARVPHALPCWADRSTGALAAAAPAVPWSVLALAGILGALALAALAAALCSLRLCLSARQQRARSKASVNVHPVDYGTIR